jgi:hypothetical protein
MYYTQKGNYFNKHKHCIKRERLNIKLIITLLVITLISVCKSRSKQWEKGEEKQYSLSGILGQRINGKETTPKQLNTINNASAY